MAKKGNGQMIDPSQVFDPAELAELSAKDFFIGFVRRTSEMKDVETQDGKSMPDMAFLELSGGLKVNVMGLEKEKGHFPKEGYFIAARVMVTKSKSLRLLEWHYISLRVVHSSTGEVFNVDFKTDLDLVFGRGWKFESQDVDPNPDQSQGIEWGL